MTANTANCATFWAYPGRFKNKPALSFNGANTLVLFPSQMIKVGALLGKSQQVSVAMWVAPTQSQLGATACVFYWPTTRATPSSAYAGPGCHVCFGNTVFFEAGTQNGNWDQVDCPYTAGSPTSIWNLWVFTKTCTSNATGGAFHVYKNGDEILPINTANGSTPPRGLLSEPGNALTATNYGLGGNSPVMGNYPGGSFWTGILDEFCIWNRELTAAEVRQMYDMGNPN